MKYFVILTKSHMVAQLLAKAHTLGEDGVCEISFGAILNDERVPAVYRDKGFFACIITYDETADVPPYDLIIA